MKDALKIYFAGDLFNHKDLTGNAALASRLTAASGNRWKVLLPQDSESNCARAVEEIRNRDLELLFQCDVLVANFDGQELDSGTVAEFMYAKFLDIPAVLLRTDFRSCSDQQAGGEPWNLMCSGYPRTHSLILHGMTLYHECFNREGSLEEKMVMYHDRIARKLIAELEAVIAEPPGLGRDIAVDHYRRAVQSAGNGLERLLTGEVLAALVAGKISRGML